MSARTRMLIKNFISAKLAGKNNGFDIAQVSEDSFEEYYILIKPKTGIYRDQWQVLHMKTKYGTGETYEYPINAPLVKFVTNVYHTNISSCGSICLDILKDKTKWMPTYDFEQIIYNIMLLYLQPNTSSPFNGQASKDYSDCRKEFNKHKNKNMSVQDEEELEEKCFQLYKDKADAFANSDLTKYAKWFPQIINQEHTDEYKDYIESMIFTIQKQEQAKKAREEAREKAKEEAREKDKDLTKKKNKWAKYQKKKE